MLIIFKALKNITNRKFWQILFVCFILAKKNSGVIGTLKVYKFIFYKNFRKQEQIVKVTHSNEATFMRALESSIGQSSCSLGVAGNRSLPSSSNGIQSSTVTLRQVP